MPKRPRVNPPPPATDVPAARHQRVRRWVEEQITQGRLAVGQRVPPEHQIMQMHGVSRGTVRRAMTELEFEGYIHRHPGKGTFVTSTRPGRRRQMHWAFLKHRLYEGGDSALEGLEAYAREAGAHLTVEVVGDTPEWLGKAVERLTGADGFIVEPQPYEINAPQRFKPLIASGKPVVLLRVPLTVMKAPLVAFDHLAVGRQAARHLLDLAHRRIGFIGAAGDWAIERQVAGYREALADAGVAVRPKWIDLDPRATDEQGLEAARRLLALEDRPTAIVAASDVAAGNVYRAAKQMGVRIPDELSVVAALGLSRHLPEALDPPLTVWCPWRTGFRLGDTAAEVLEALVDRRWPADVSEVLVDPAPLPRGSAASPPV